MSLKGVEGVYLPPELAEDLTKLTRAYLDPNGHEVLNPMPLVHHSDLTRPLTLQEQIARILRTREFTHAMQAQRRETWEEANDFNVPEDETLYGSDETAYTLMQDEFPTEAISKNGTTLSQPPSGKTEEPAADPPQSAAASDSTPPAE